MKKNDLEELETYIEMKRIFLEDCMKEVAAAKRAFEDKKWYLQEHENYVKMDRSYSKEAERCWEKVQRLDEEINSHVIEANICLLGAVKVYLKGMEYTIRIFSK